MPSLGTGFSLGSGGSGYRSKHIGAIFTYEEARDAYDRDFERRYLGLEPMEETFNFPEYKFELDEIVLANSLLMKNDGMNNIFVPEKTRGKVTGRSMVHIINGVAEKYSVAFNLNGKVVIISEIFGILLDKQHSLKRFMKQKKGFIMNLLKNFSNLFTSEPEKSFRKLGITNDCDILTADGQQIFMSWLLQKNKNEFKIEVIDKLLEEEKEKL